MRNLAIFLKQTEHRKNLPATLFHFDALTLRKDTGYVFVEAAAGDVSYAMNVDLLEHLMHLLHIDAGGGEEHLSESLIACLLILLVKVEVVVGHYLTHETETVGVYTGRGDAHEHVARFNLRAVDEFILLYSSYGESGDVVVVFSIHARHLGSLTAYESAACLTASLSYTGHDSLHNSGMVLTDSYIVEEQERFGTLGEHVVDAHSHSVDSDGVMFVKGKREFQLCAYTVGAAYEDGMFITE